LLRVKDPRTCRASSIGNTLSLMADPAPGAARNTIPRHPALVARSPSHFDLTTVALKSPW
jgi:hypothetical protein